MKKLIIMAVVLFALQVTAQGQKKEKNNRGDRSNKMENVSAEDMATLQTKKMTLYLDLNASQQTEIMKINLDNATKRKAMMAERKANKEKGADSQKPTQEKRLKMANAKLDHKIAVKAKMKNILNKEQFAKWEKSQMRMAKKGKNKKRGNKKDTQK